jgi:hypothetical protein
MKLLKFPISIYIYYLLSVSTVTSMYKTIKYKKTNLIKSAEVSIINKFILTRKNIFSPILPFKIILILRSHAFTLPQSISYHSFGYKIMEKYLKNINIEVTNLIIEN